MAITLQSVVNRELLPSEVDENFRDIDQRTLAGWKDLTAHITIEGIDVADAPTYQSFAPSGLKKQLVFEVNDYANASIYHMNHDMKVGGKAYIHIHWSTDGIDENPIKWEFQISNALGHDQDFFPAATSIFVEQTPNQVTAGPWRHYIAEVEEADAMTMQEPDALALVTVRRVTNGAVDNLDQVFGLMIDFHYESDRDSTPNKAPDFYV